MDLFEPCTCSDSGIWDTGLGTRKNGDLKCLNCLGSVKREEVQAQKLPTKNIDVAHCRCGTPLLEDLSDFCHRCKETVESNRLKLIKTSGVNRVKRNVMPLKKKSDSRTLWWIVAIFALSAIVGGVLSMNEKSVEPNGYTEEQNYEENGNPDTFIGTP